VFDEGCLVQNLVATILLRVDLVALEEKSVDAAVAEDVLMESLAIGMDLCMLQQLSTSSLTCSTVLMESISTDI